MCLCNSELGFLSEYDLKLLIFEDKTFDVSVKLTFFRLLVPITKCIVQSHIVIIEIKSI